MALKAAKNAKSGLHAALTHSEPLALSFAVFFGLLWGWLPKPGLMAIAVFIAPLFVRTNLLVTLAASIIAWLSFAWMSPKLLRLGSSILEWESLQSTYVELSRLPMLPWLDWDNNLVLGATATSLIAFCGTYFAARCFARNRRQTIFASPQVIISTTPVAKVEPSVARDDPFEQLEALLADLESMPLSPSSVAYSPSDVITDTIEPSPKQKTDSTQHRIDIAIESVFTKPKVIETQETVRANAAMAASAPEVVVAESSSLDASSTTANASSTDRSTRPVLKETVIEIVRYKPHNKSFSKGLIKGPLTVRTSDRSNSEDPSPKSPTIDGLSSSTSSSIDPDFDDSSHPIVAPFAMQSTTSPIVTQSETTEQVLRVHADARELPSTSLGLNQDANDRPREEALRYLLWHLSGVKRSETPMVERSS